MLCTQSLHWHKLQDQVCKTISLFFVWHKEKIEVCYPEQCVLHTPHTACYSYQHSPCKHIQWRVSERTSCHHLKSTGRYSHGEGDSSGQQDNLLFSAASWCLSHRHKIMSPVFSISETMMGILHKWLAALAVVWHSWSLYCRCKTWPGWEWTEAGMSV